MTWPLLKKTMHRGCYTRRDVSWLIDFYCYETWSSLWGAGFNYGRAGFNWPYWSWDGRHIFCLKLRAKEALGSIQYKFNLVPRVLGLFGQRVSARRETLGWWTPFSQKTWVPVLLRMLEFKRKQKRENSKQQKWWVESFRETKILALDNIKATGEMIIGLL